LPSVAVPVADNLNAPTILKAVCFAGLEPKDLATIAADEGLDRDPVPVDFGGGFVAGHLLSPFLMNMTIRQFLRTSTAKCALMRFFSENKPLFALSRNSL
jgi:hypothetical protein